jgi:hypothetical protein
VGRGTTFEVEVSAGLGGWNERMRGSEADQDQARRIHEAAQAIPARDFLRFQISCQWRIAQEAKSTRIGKIASRRRLLERKSAERPRW